MKALVLSGGGAFAQYDLEDNFIAEFKSYKEAGESIGVTYAAIKNCIARKTFKCKGYKWKKINN